MNPNSYENLLKDWRWIERRQEILKRDKNCCAECSNSKIKDHSKIGIFHNLIDRASSFEAFFKGSYEKKKSLELKFKVRYKVIIRSVNNDSFQGASFSIWPELFGKRGEKYLESDDLLYYYELLENDKGIVTLIEDTTRSESSRSIFVRSLHVHHRYYQEETLPWEYPDSALITLCWRCHEEYHKNNKVEWLDKKGLKKGVLIPCSKCHGAGYFPQYSHIQNGICFQCRGMRYKQFFEEI